MYVSMLVQALSTPERKRLDRLGPGRYRSTRRYVRKAMVKNLFDIAVVNAADMLIAHAGKVNVFGVSVLTG